MNYFNTPLDMTTHLAAAAPMTRHYVAVNPNNGVNTGIAPVSLPNYLGGGAILLLLVGMLGVAKSAAAPNNRHLRILTDLGKIHHDNVLKTLEHRLQVAKNRGDQHLIQLLEQERNQIG